MIDQNFKDICNKGDWPSMLKSTLKNPRWNPPQRVFSVLLHIPHVLLFVLDSHHSRGVARKVRGSLRTGY